jgi:hypothetical protein
MNKATFEKKLAEWCEPVKGSDIYFRPFLTKDVPSENGIFIVGINPATAILRSKKLPTEEYAASLHDNYDKFKNIYNKKESPTRNMIDNLVVFLKIKLNETGNPRASIFETDMNAYPAEGEDELKKLEKEEPETFKRGQEIFGEVFEFFKPKMLILHGNSARESMTAYIKKNKLKMIRNPHVPENFKEWGIERLEAEGNPLYTSEDGTCVILVCRNLWLFERLHRPEYDQFTKNFVAQCVKKVF